MSLAIWTPDRIDRVYEDCVDDFGKFSYDGFGIMLSDEQLEVAQKIGPFGPVNRGEHKFNWLSGGQRGGKTVEGFLFHANACLYKRGLDPTDSAYWENYQYGTLAIAPSNELSLRLWAIADAIQKGASEAQYDRNARRARGGAFLNEFSVGRAGEWAIVRFENGSHIDFRSAEGKATRLEGGQWWGTTYDEWATQPARELRSVIHDVLLGRNRDHNGKIILMAWPKPETEYLLIEVQRAIAAKRQHDSQVVFLSAAKAYFTNKRALAVEKRSKTAAEWMRTVEGKPAGGASIIFKPAVVAHAIQEDLTYPVLPQQGYAYLHSWDVALAHDANVGLTWRIPIVDGKKIVTPNHPARIVNATCMPGSEDLTIDRVGFTIIGEQATYHGQTAIDATAMGGIAAFRMLKGMSPSPWAFVSRGQDRLWGNLRTAAITNGMDCMSWGRNPSNVEGSWGLVEMPRIVPLLDQLASFDPDGKDIPDDWVWSFLIGLWYIRRHYAIGDPGAYQTVPFDVRKATPLSEEPGRTRRKTPLIKGPEGPDLGIVYINPRDPFTGVRPRATVPAARRS